MSAAVPLPWPALPRRACVVAGVVAVHAMLLWWAARATLVRPVENVVPVQLLEAVLAPAQLQQAPAPPPILQPPHRTEAPAPPRHPEVRHLPKARPPEHAPAAAPAHPAAARPATAMPPQPVPARPTTAATPQPAPARPTTAATPQPAPAPPATAAARDLATAPAAVPAQSTAAAPPAAPAAAPSPAPPSSAKVELPISNADYLQNPKPEWPRASQRLGEKGLVMLRVLIGTDGRARKAEVVQSSGYPRLDNASVAAVLQWRYVPGKRGGVPEEMWFKVPIRWGDGGDPDHE